MTRLFISLVFLFTLFLNPLFAKDILLFKVYDEKSFKDINLSHYLMSEKLDGEEDFGVVSLCKQEQEML